MKKLLAMVLVLALLLTGCAADNNGGIVDTFNYADIKGQVEAVALSDGGNTEQIKETLKKLSDIDQLVRKDESRLDRYIGMILVVEPQKSVNIVRTEAGYQNKSEGTVLKSDQVYKNITNVTYLKSQSYTETTVKIKEILFQQENSDVTVGDTVQLGERYWIADARVPNLVKTSDKSKRYSKYFGSETEWMGMEAGETYVIFCRYYVEDASGKEDSPFSEKIWTESYGIYCLSDLTKQAGAWKDAETLADGIAYLKQNYDLSKYGLK